jgi:F-type H+-transporting ATPase subunit delta
MSTKQERASRYAQALWMVQLERWQKALADATQAIAGDAQLSALLDDGAVSGADKAAALEKALPAGFPGEVLNLLKVMADRNDMALVDDVTSRLTQAVTGKEEELKAEITSAYELTEDEKEQVRRRLKSEHGAGLTSFVFSTDPALMGGLRIRVGDRLIDNSVATRLAALRESLAAVVR